MDLSRVLEMTPGRMEVVRAAQHAAVATSLGFGIALAAGAVGFWKGHRMGGGLYAVASIAAGLWYAEHNPVAGGVLAVTGITMGVSMVLELVALRLATLRSPAGVVTMAYNSAAGPFSFSPADAASRVLSAAML